MYFDPRIIHAQKFSVPCYRVDIEALSFSPFSVHKLKDWVGRIRVLEQDAFDLKQRPVQMREAPLGNAAGLGIENRMYRIEMAARPLQQRQSKRLWVNRRTLPISVISCGPVISPAPCMDMTTSNSGSSDAKRIISPRITYSAS